MTSALTAGPAVTGRPQLVPVPDCEPPYDDDPSPLHRIRPLRSPARRARYRSSAAVLPAPGMSGQPERVTSAVPSWSDEPDVGIRRTVAAELPDPRHSGTILARGLVEVLCGLRPMEQLRVHCSPPVYAGLQELPMVRGAGLPKVLSVHVCAPDDGVAEVTAVFRRAERTRAMAFRLQGVDGRWRVTALQVG